MGDPGSDWADDAEAPGCDESARTWDATPELPDPISDGEILTNMRPGSDAKKASLLDQSLARRLADRKLIERLALTGFRGPAYVAFEAELLAYAVAVLRAWLYSGFIFTVACQRNYRLTPTNYELEELARSSDLRQELANMTVGMTIGRFRTRALRDGGWRFEGGASIKTYFLGACMFTFPNVFRAYRRDHRRWTSGQAMASDLQPGLTDPAAIVSSTSVVRDFLASLDDRQRAVAALTIDGYTHTEIAEVLGETSVRAVEGVLYRLRRQHGGATEPKGGGIDG